MFHAFWPGDLFGIGVIISSLQDSIKTAFPEYTGSFAAVFVFRERQLKLFEWPGVDWTWELVASRLLWIIPALVLVLIASRASNSQQS